MKKRLIYLSFLLCCTLLLSGCSLVVKDAKVDGARVALSVNGEVRTKAEFEKDYQAALTQQRQLEQLYQNYGISMPAKSDAEVLTSAMDGAVRALVLDQKAASLRFDELTEDEEKKVKEDAAVRYQNEVNRLKTQLFAGSALTDEQLNAAASKEAEKLGLTLNVAEQAARRTFIQEKLRQEAIKDVTVTAEEITAELNVRTEADKTTFQENKDAFGKAVNSGKPYYFAPEDYRMVKQVLVKFTADDQKAIDEAKASLAPLENALNNAKSAVANAEEGKKQEAEDALKAAQTAYDAAKATLDAALEKGYANIEQKANIVYERAQAEDFTALIAEFNEDLGQPEKGYAITKDFADFDSAFVEPAMSLAAVGEVAKPSKGMYGYYIVQYAADVPQGPVALTEVQDTIKADLLKTKQDEAYAKAVETWISEAKVETHAEVMK